MSIIAQDMLMFQKMKTNRLLHVACCFCSLPSAAICSGGASSSSPASSSSSSSFSKVDFPVEDENGVEECGELGHDSGITKIIIAPQLLPFSKIPVVGFGPKSTEMNPSAFPDLPIHPRTLGFDQKIQKIVRKYQDKNPTKQKISYYCLILPDNN